MSLALFYSDYVSLLILLVITTVLLLQTFIVICDSGLRYTCLYSVYVYFINNYNIIMTLREWNYTKSNSKNVSLKLMCTLIAYFIFVLF